MTDKTLTKAALQHFTGTENWYRHGLFRQFTYTDGVQYVAEHGGAYWLLEAIFSWQSEASVKAEPFQVWTLTVNEDQTANLEATDGNRKKLAQQHFDFTDFPLPKIRFYLTDNVLLLPSEY